MFECYALWCLQINNGPFNSDWAEKRKEHVTCQRGKENKFNKKERKDEIEDRSDNTIHQMYIICFNGMRIKKQKEKEKRKKGILWERNWRDR